MAASDDSPSVSVVVLGLGADDHITLLMYETHAPEFHGDWMLNDTT